MPLFNVRVLSGQQSPAGAASAGFLAGSQQAFGMAAQAAKMQEQRRQFDAMSPMREAQARVQTALADKVEGLLQGEIAAGNARNAAIPVQTELQTQALEQQVASGVLRNEIAAYNFDEQQQLAPQRILAARAAAVEAEVQARTALTTFNEFNSPQAAKIRSYTREAQARMLGKGLDKADADLRAATLRVEAEEFALQQLQSAKAVTELSDEAYAAGFGAIRDTLPKDLADAVQGIFDAEDSDMTPAMRGAAAKQVVKDYYEQKSFQFARSATTSMTTLNRKLRQMPTLMQDADFARSLSALGTAQRQGNYAMASAIADGLVKAADDIAFSETKSEEGLTMLTSLQATYGSLGSAALDNNRLPKDIGESATMTPSGWLDHQQSALEELKEDRLTEGEWWRWVHQTLDPLDTSQDMELMKLRIQAMDWVLGEQQGREAMGSLMFSAPTTTTETQGGAQTSTSDGLENAFKGITIRQ